jgi:transposase
MAKRKIKQKRKIVKTYYDDMLREYNPEILLIKRKLSCQSLIDYINKILNTKWKSSLKNNVLNVNKFLKDMYCNSHMEYLNDKKYNSSNKNCNKITIDDSIVGKIFDKNKNVELTLKKMTMEYNSLSNSEPISMSKYYNNLKKLGYSYKKLSTINPIVTSENSLKKQVALIEYLVTSISENQIVLFADECPLHINIKRTKGWTKHDNYIENSIGNKRFKRMTLMYLIGTNSKSYWQITYDIVNAEKYWNFIKQGIEYFGKSKSFKKCIDDKNVIILMDNAKVHYRRDIRSNLISHNVKILYSVPYCCHLNPIEICFGMLKKNLKTKNIKEEDDIVNKTMEYLDHYGVKDIYCSIRYCMMTYISTIKKFLLTK